MNQRVIAAQTPSPSSAPTVSDLTSPSACAATRMHQCSTVPSGVNLMDNAGNKIDKQRQDGDGEAEIQSDDDETSSDDSYVKVAISLLIFFPLKMLIKIPSRHSRSEAEVLGYVSD